MSVIISGILAGNMSVIISGIMSGNMSVIISGIVSNIDNYQFYSYICRWRKRFSESNNRGHTMLRP